MPFESAFTVSVVIPLFNKAEHVRQAIDSVVAQSRVPDEILVIDDGSTDGSDRVVQEYASRVSLLKKPHKGVSAARNFGIETAKGSAIAFLDADDVWKPHFLEKVTALLERFPQAGVAASGYEFLTKGGQVSQFHFAGIPRHSWQGIIDYFACMAANGVPPLHASGVIARTDVLKHVGGFPVGVRWGEDHDTWARLAIATDIAFTNEILFTVNIIATNRATDSLSPRPTLPAVTTVTKLLATVNDNRRRANLQKYLKRLLFISVITNLRYDHALRARKQLILYRHLSGLGPRWFALAFCSFLPHPLVRMLGLLRKGGLACQKWFYYRSSKPARHPYEATRRRAVEETRRGSVNAQ